MPMPMIRKLQIPYRQKIGLVRKSNVVYNAMHKLTSRLTHQVLMFAIGSLTMVTSIVRLVLMPPLVEATDL